MAMLRVGLTLTGVILMAASAFAADERIVQAYRQGGAAGVVSVAEAVAKDEGSAAAVKALSSALQHKNVELRAAAAHALGRMGDAGRVALPELAAALTRDDPRTLSQSLNELGPGDIPLWLAEAALARDDTRNALSALESVGLKDDRLVPILQKGLGHSDVRVQWSAVELLGCMAAKGAPAREALVRLLQAEPTRRTRADGVCWPNELRAMAADSLGRMGAEPDQTVSLLTGMLKHEDPAIRIGAAQGLGRMGDRAQAAIPALVECLADEKMVPTYGRRSVYQHHCAADALVDIGPSSIPAIIGALDAQQVTVRRHAAEALECFAPEAAQPAAEALFQRLHDPDPEVRCTAIHILGWLAPHAESLVPELVRLVRDEDPTVRIQAATTLQYVAPKDMIPLEPLTQLLDRPDLDGCRADAVLEVLSVLAPSAVIDSANHGLLQAPDSSIQLAVMRSLGGIGREAKAAVPTLTKLLKDQDSTIRSAAARTLGDIGPDAAATSSALMELLEDYDVYVRQSAVTALGKIGPAATAVPVLTAMLKDHDGRICGDTIVALAEFGPAAAASLPALTELLQDDDRYVRQVAVIALGRIGPATAAVPAVAGLLKDADPNVRGATAETLGRIGPAAAAACPVLNEMLKDEDRYVWKSAAIALAKIDPAATIIPMLTGLLEDDDPNVRSAAADALGEIGPAAAASFPALLESLKDKRGIVRAAAVVALAEIRPAEATVPSIMTMLSDEDSEVRDAAVSALGTIGPEAAVAVPPLIRLCTADSASVGMTSILALGEIGPAAKEAVPVLTRSLTVFGRSQTEIERCCHGFATRALRQITKADER